MTQGRQRGAGPTFPFQPAADQPLSMARSRHRLLPLYDPLGETARDQRVAFSISLNARTKSLCAAKKRASRLDWQRGQAADYLFALVVATGLSKAHGKRNAAP